MRIIFFTISILVLTTFCSDSITETESFNLFDDIIIEYNQKLVNDDENISIQFTELVGDSRCPIDAICVWEGDAEIKFRFSKNNSFEDFTLHTSINYFNADTLLFGYRIELVEVFPYPQINIEIPSKDYKVKIKIEKE
ncbi:MAG: hypothetical protein IPH62_10185 [Ignavibacteriae bacterium]|nr:hypothetical protein [Ignavibacteriota bacterium]